MQKRGAEINITTIIIIILALLVLVILALYFTGGMKSLWEQITTRKAAWDTTSVESARMVCESYCSGNHLDLFCATPQKIKGEKGETVEKKCDEDPINAWRLPECQKAGFTKKKCKEYREGIEQSGE